MVCGTHGSVAAEVGLREGELEPITDCQATEDWRMPLIAWGADGVTLWANGASIETRAGHFSRNGLRLSLYAENDFQKQIDDYRSCRSPFLRGTLGMLTAAADATEGDERTRQVVFVKLSWSVGDGLVASPGILSLADLRGRRIAMQRLGPHVDLVARLLADAGVMIDEVDIVWTQELTGASGDTPIAAFERGDADAAAVILADARAIVDAGGDKPKARLLASTREASTVVGDYISVRSDWFGAHRTEATALTAALLEAEAEMRGVMADRSDPRRLRMSEVMGEVLLGGASAEDGALLWEDAVTDGLADNARHFGDSDDPRRFEALSGEVGEALERIGVLSKKPKLAAAGWDYGAIARLIGQPAEPERADLAAPIAVRTNTARLRRAGRLQEAVIVGLDLEYDPTTGEVEKGGEGMTMREALRVAATYAGSPILIEGHSDPMRVLTAARAGADSGELRRLRQEARDQAVNLAERFRDDLVAVISAEGHEIDPSRLIVEGVGGDAPLHPLPRTEAEWRANHRLRLLVLSADAFDGL